MSLQDEFEYQLDTLAIRTGHTRSFEGEHGEPIFLTSSFVYENAAEAAAKFSGQEPGNIYSHFTNPTVAMFEKRLAALEGAERAVATSSGMAAIMAVAMSFLKLGDGKVTEVILATNATVEGQATAHYLVEATKHLPIQMTRIAQGVPQGGELEYVDSHTLSQAVHNRMRMK